MSRWFSSPWSRRSACRKTRPLQISRRASAREQGSPSTSTAQVISRQNSAPVPRRYTALALKLDQSWPRLAKHWPTSAGASAPGATGRIWPTSGRVAEHRPTLIESWPKSRNTLVEVGQTLSDLAPNLARFGLQHANLAGSVQTMVAIDQDSATTKCMTIGAVTTRYLRSMKLG